MTRFQKEKKHSQNIWPQKSWTTLFSTPFIIDLTWWAHLIHYPFTNRFSTLTMFQLDEWRLLVGPSSNPDPDSIFKKKVFKEFPLLKGGSSPAPRMWT